MLTEDPQADIAGVHCVTQVKSSDDQQSNDRRGNRLSNRRGVENHTDDGRRGVNSHTDDGRWAAGNSMDDRRGANENTDDDGRREFICNTDGRQRPGTSSF